MSGDSEMTKPNGWTGEVWSVVRHSWSDTSVVGPDGTIVTLSIYDKATEETQVYLEALMAKRARLIAAAPSLYEALAGYMAAVENMNQSMRDGLNVHGAMSALVGWEDIARAALSAAEGGV